MIIKKGGKPAVSVVLDGAVSVAPDGAGDLIRGWRGVCAEAGKSRVQLWRDIRAKRFPPPIEIGPNSVAWFRAEVEAWKSSRPRRTYRSEIA
jgi:predicted DNA-binding transcriptional regulator AlpA